MTPQLIHHSSVNSLPNSNSKSPWCSRVPTSQQDGKKIQPRIMGSGLECDGDGEGNLIPHTSLHGPPGVVGRELQDSRGGQILEPKTGH